MSGNKKEERYHNAIFVVVAKITFEKFVIMYSRCRIFDKKAKQTNTIHSTFDK